MHTHHNTKFPCCTLEMSALCCFIKDYTIHKMLGAKEKQTTERDQYVHKHTVSYPQRNGMETLSWLTEQQRKGRSKVQATQDLSFKSPTGKQTYNCGKQIQALSRAIEGKPFCSLCACCSSASQNVKNTNKSPHVTSKHACTLIVFPASISF